MKIEMIYEKVKNLEVKPIDVKKEYSVLIPIIEVDGELHILYELRSKDLQKQPQEISFPGGAVEVGETFEEAAVRETVEELKIAYENIKILKELDYLVASRGIRINCFLGVIEGIKIEDINPNAAEVDHVFSVPIDWLMKHEPDEYNMHLSRKLESDFPYNLIPNGENYKWQDGKDKIHFYKYKSYNIWGFTAKMTKNFIDKIRN